MADPGHVETEKILKQLENRIRKEYKQATEEMQEKIDEYWSKYKLKDQKWQEWVRDGKKTAKEYQMWEQQQLMVGKSWESLKTSLAEDMVHANDVAKAMTKATMPDVYAENFNYGTFSVEKAAKVDTSFTLYDQSTVTRILKDDPDLLPAPGKKVSKQIADGKAMRWNKQQIQSVMTQGILQGESIPKLSKRLATTVGERNYKSAIRNARTMTTGAQNAGRMDSYKRAESKGIDLEVEWIATLDNRTRHEHRMLDGQTRPVGEPFEVHGIKIDYAGDPNAPARMIYNCRCTLAGHVKGFNAAEVERDTSGIGGMSYDDWKKEKRSQSNPIDLPEQKGKAIAGKYRNEYREGSQVLKSESENGKIKLKTNEKQEQDYGMAYGDREHPLIVDKEYFESEEFRNKFRNATGNKETDDALYFYSKKAAIDNSGTRKESMYLIDARNGELFAKVDGADSRDEGVKYTELFKQKLKEANDNDVPIVAVHSHPYGTPPSSNDFRKAYENNYQQGFVIGANGQ